MLPRPVLRPAVAQDAPLIRGMVRAARINPFSLDWRRFLVAEASGSRVAGFVQVKPHSDGSRELASLVVLPAYRGQGVARLLIETVQSRQPRPLYLTCRRSLVPLYQKFGFLPLERSEQPPYFRRLSGLAGLIQKVARIRDGMIVMVW